MCFALCAVCSASVWLLTCSLSLTVLLLVIYLAAEWPTRVASAASKRPHSAIVTTAKGIEMVDSSAVTAVPAVSTITASSPSTTTQWITAPTVTGTGSPP